jgi:hypothetical protein
MKMIVGNTWNAKIAPEKQVSKRPRIRKPELTKQHPRSGEGGREHVGDHAAGPTHEHLPVVEAQHNECEGELQAEAPGDGPPADMLAVGRAQPRSQQHSQNSQHSRESSQCGAS